MNTFTVADIKPLTFFKADLMLDENFLLCSSSCPVSESLLKALQEWGFKTVQSEGSVGMSTSTPAEVEKEKEKLSKAVSIAEKLKAAKQKVMPNAAAPAKNAAGLEKSESIDISEFGVVQTDFNSEKSAAQKDTAGGTQEAAQNEPVTEVNEKEEAERLSKVQAVYSSYMDFINTVYTRYATHKQLDLEAISSTVEQLCAFIKENRRYVLRVTPSEEVQSKSFLISHSMRSTVLAITIGLQLHMPENKLVELGVASILHEIGMLRLPPQLYLNDRPLTPVEKAQISTHPIISYNILKDAKFPLGIQLGVLEHHEHETGTGYPRKISGKKISLYAKIIAVACSYEAITAPRQYKEEQTAYEGMVELLKNEKHLYDDIVVKALLYSLSIFPIGSYVYLSNGKIAQVTDVFPGDPKNPIVQLIGEKDASETTKNIQTNDSDMKIVRVMNKHEVEDVLKALKQAAAEKQEINS
ncbi:MAG: HD-GYP domain-containing protein [Treponema sp.]|nr:HD-GYP domain-containing protein [Treponema sp.]